MTRILLVETASPKRILRKAEQILSSGLYPDPDIAILCIEGSGPRFRNLPGVRLYPISARMRCPAFQAIRQEFFDVIYAFWTGEKGYRRMKLRVFRLKAKAILIDSGDGNEFPLTRKAVCRHSAFRWKHPLPTDHGDFIETKANPDGDKVLIVQSAEPSHVLKALRRLEDKPLFVNPRFTLFCRQKPEVIRSFQGHPLLHRILAHSETRGSLGHLRNLRQERFDAVVIFFTGDPGFLKIKVFAFLLGIRHKLIFNESNDCFFLTFNRWLGFMARRMKAQASSGTRVSAGSSQRVVLSLILKTVILPFRFVWLLLVWLHLRFESWRYSR